MRKVQLLEKMRVASIIFGLVVIGFIFKVGTDQSYSWPPKIYQSDNVYNLTKEKVSWDVYYGPEKQCLIGSDCDHVSAYQGVYAEKNMVLPSR